MATAVRACQAASRPAGLLRISVIGVEHDGVGAEPAELLKVVEDLLEGPMPGWSGSAAAAVVSLRAILGAKAGSEWRARRSTQLAQGTPSGCQASPN